VDLLAEFRVVDIGYTIACLGIFTTMDDAYIVVDIISEL